MLNSDQKCYLKTEDMANDIFVIMTIGHTLDDSNNCAQTTNKEKKNCVLNFKLQKTIFMIDKSVYCC